jgi:hypothetical protein
MELSFRHPFTRSPVDEQENPRAIRIGIKSVLQPKSLCRDSKLAEGKTRFSKQSGEEKSRLLLQMHR